MTSGRRSRGHYLSSVNGFVAGINVYSGISIGNALFLITHDWYLLSSPFQIDTWNLVSSLHLPHQDTWH